MEQEKFNWKRLLITTLIVVIAMGTAGGAVWYVMDMQAKQDEENLEQRIKALEEVKKTEVKEDGDSNDWKTYTSSKGFSFNYPSDWTLEKDGIEGASVGAVPTPQSSLALRKGSSYLSIFWNPGGWGFECANPVIQYKTTFKDGMVTLSDRQQSQATAEDLEVTGPSCGYAVTTSFSQEGSDYFIMASGEEKDLAKDEPIAKKVIETITFK
jgi:hypothetical protein